MPELSELRPEVENPRLERANVFQTHRSRMPEVETPRLERANVFQTHGSPMPEVENPIRRFGRQEYPFFATSRFMNA